MRLAGGLLPLGTVGHGLVLKEVEEALRMCKELEDRLVVSGGARVWWGALGSFFEELEGWW